LEFRRKETFYTSSIFDRGKTVVPEKVRTDLNAQDGDNLLWVKRVDGYLVRSTVEPVRLINETLKRGGITCKKCGTNYEALREACPKCGTPTPKPK
jgi:bifunctional DNA-binding transcriptional regulator/antitoxin component of YhaV-PrlF toxin-antitoxin module